uniref:Tocopherol cyclase n=1 Tax=Dunaliella tertiolecta TaxID=3047 RepID=A0A7S3VSV1_DUNTE
MNAANGLYRFPASLNLHLKSAARLPGIKRKRAHTSASVLPPHSGYHYDGSPRRFFEGWYWRVTVPEADGESFALIYSIEDPAGTSPNAGLGVQVMGPKDGYLCQFSRNTGSFWADQHGLALGATIKPRGAVSPRTMVNEEEFQKAVEHGFQASSTMQQGSIIANEAGTTGRPMSSVSSASWNFNITPRAGWGSPTSPSQLATAGWLSMVPVFEPHWQVLMSQGSATGWFEWGGRRMEFVDAPAYAEKNWGGGFPSKWHWVQCNTFDGQPNLSVTAVGARRGLLLGAEGVGLGEEDVGLIGVTYNSEWIELVPWNSELEWDVDPWGRWYIKAANDKYEAVVEARCSPSAGAVLRAPTADQGLSPACKDTFAGEVRLRVWKRGSPPGSASDVPYIDATSRTAALEVGGGPWWSAWSAKASMKEPFKSLVTLPIDVAALARMVPQPLKPPGL